MRKYDERVVGSMRLGDIAGLIRSKNAGPFMLTFDIMFSDLDSYQRVVDSNVITKELIQRLYGTELENIQIFYYDAAMAIKVSIPRTITSGDPLDTDVYGGQQYGPLVHLEVP